MAAGDIIFDDGTILTPADLQKLLPEIITRLNSTAKDPGDYEEATSLQGVSSIPTFFKSGNTYKLVRTPMSLLKGADGREIELIVDAQTKKLKAHYVGETEWTDLFDLSTLQGESAYQLWLKQEGNADKTEEEFLESIKGSPFIYTDFTPEQLALLKGETGSSPEFEWDGTQLRFKAPDGTWGAYVNLKGVTGDAFTYADFTAAQLASLKGDPGANIELQKNATHVQWRVVGSDAWSDLIPIADLKGDKGDPLRWADLTAEQKAELKGEPGSIEQGDAHNLTVSFTESEARENLMSGDTLAILFGKLKKQFGDLKNVAFTGDYSDLQNTPSVPGSDFYSLPEAIMSLSPDSTSDEISTVIGGVEGFNAIATNSTKVFKNGTFVLQVSATSSSNATTLHFAITSTIEGARMIFNITKTGEVFSYALELMDYGVRTDKENSVQKLITKGAGTKYLSDNGEYKTISTDIEYLDLVAIFGFGSTIKESISEEELSIVLDKFDKKVTVGKMPFFGGAYWNVPISMVKGDSILIISFDILSIENGECVISVWNVSVNLSTRAVTTTDVVNKKLSTNDYDATAKAVVDKLTGVNTVTTLASLPVTKRSIVATLSAATNISLASALSVGEELIIRCIPAAAFTQPIPTTGGWSSMSGSSFDATSGVVFEISIWCYAASSYAVVIKEAE